MRILLIISGSIAAYKSLDLIRRLRERGAEVRCILTKGGAEFITPLSVASLSGNPIYEDLFSLKDETEMGHIRLSREADLIVVAPASADILAKMAGGIADDLATTCLLATDIPVLAAPAMNSKMWEHAATQRNVAQLKADGVRFVEPASGDLACGEVGSGRLAEIEDILTAIFSHSGKLSGKKAIVTSGPTHEPIDPVRFIGNRSSGKQGHAIAQALAAQGAEVTLISGPTNLPDPVGVRTIHVESARDMLKAVEASLPAEIAVCAAAVADWRAKQTYDRKLKKRSGHTPPAIELEENPDILHILGNHKTLRPRLVIGFAAETGDVEIQAVEKRTRKGCDWIIANDVTGGDVFNQDRNRVFVVDDHAQEWWPELSKSDVARRLVEKIAERASPDTSKKITRIKRRQT